MAGHQGYISDHLDEMFQIWSIVQGLSSDSFKHVLLEKISC